MKKIVSLLLFFMSIVAFAQIPTGYYDSATGTGYTLKTQLSKIIDNTNDGIAAEYLAIDNGYDGLYTAYQTTDIDNFNSDIYENDGTVLDMYSESESTAMADPYNFNHTSTEQCGNYTGEGQCYNREHIFPQGFFNEQFPMKSDIHFVTPTDGYVNNRRSNYPFGEVSNPSWTSQNGSKVGNNTSSSDYIGNAFEPIDEYKGDIARMLFYFATRYENEVTSNSWDAHDAVVENPLNGTNDQVYEDWYVNLLVSWHLADPVSEREIARNNAAFTYQNNRNPFIDHPEWVTVIWTTTIDTEKPTSPTNLVASNPTSNTIDLNWTAATDNVAVISYDIYIDGIYNSNTSSTSFVKTGLESETTYCFTIYAKDAAGNTSVASNEACETTSVSGNNGSVTALLISEYIEGSSNNKALEIANYTGATVDLSAYSLKLSSNGSTSWTYTYTFPTVSQILDKDVFVIGNGSLAICTNVVDDTNSSITAFNGNDAIGLFKNDVLIDMIGILGDGTTFAQNKTLVRNSNITSPNTTFTISEWAESSQDTCTNLGSHNITLSTHEYQMINTNIYPNPVSGNILNINSQNKANVEIYDILGKKAVVDYINSSKNNIDISNLNQGIYIVKITTDNFTSTKKLVRQ